MDTAIFDADSHLMETPEWLGTFAGFDESTSQRFVWRNSAELLGLA